MDFYPIIYLNQTSKISGAERSLLALWKGLSKKFRPILVLPETGPLEWKAKELSTETIILPELPKWGEKNQLKKMIQILRSAIKLKNIIQNKKAKLIHANGPRIGYASGLAARLAIIPSIIHVRDIHLSPFSSPLKALLFDYLADQIIAVSEATKQAIISKRPGLNRKTKVIYNGLDLEEIDSIKAKDIKNEYKIDPDVSLIGLVGIIHPVKGIDILIRAAPLIKKSFPKVKFLIIGDTMNFEGQLYLKKLKELIAQFELENDVIFTGYQEETLSLIKSLDIFVHSAIYPDPLPRAILEAAACGRPIIATRVGGVPEIIDHNQSGLMVESGDVNGLAQSCLFLLRDRKVAEKLGQRAKQKITEKFTLERHCRQIERIYFELIESKPCGF